MIYIPLERMTQSRDIQVDEISQQQVPHPNVETRHPSFFFLPRRAVCLHAAHTIENPLFASLEFLLVLFIPI